MNYGSPAIHANSCVFLEVSCTEVSLLDFSQQAMKTDPWWDPLNYRMESLCSLLQVQCVAVWGGEAECGQKEGALTPLLQITYKHCACPHIISTRDHEQW